jgi:CHASE2 domain-containing sensor protein
MAFFIVLGLSVILSIVLWRLKKFQRKYLEPTFIWVALVGILCLFQPFSYALFTYGFGILLAGILGFNVAIHIK